MLAFVRTEHPSGALPVVRETFLPATWEYTVKGIQLRRLAIFALAMCKGEGYDSRFRFRKCAPESYVWFRKRDDGGIDFVTPEPGSLTALFLEKEFSFRDTENRKTARQPGLAARIFSRLFGRKGV